MKRINRVFVAIDRRLLKAYSRIYCYIMFYLNGVKYKAIPVVYGIFRIRNFGEFRIGDNVSIISASSQNLVGISKRSTFYVGGSANLFIGDNVGLSGVSIFCSKRIIIEDFVNIGGNVSIWDTDFHPLDRLLRRKHSTSDIKCSAIKIESDVFIGANSIVLKGVNIGKGAIIGAGSIVSRDIPAFEVWAGNPIQFIRRLSK